VAADDWFRQANWTEQIEREFFVKLAKTRTQRDQYLAIQAMTLANAQPEVALRLVDIYFKTKTTSFNDVRALDARARANQALGRVSESVSTMKEILETEREHPGFKTNTFTDFPYFVAVNRLSSEYDAALKTLIDREADLAFPISRFKWHAAMSIINAELDNQALAKVHAKLAIDAASVVESGLRYHPGLGLVDERFGDVAAQLRRIAT
jgi:hypothetical protein